MPAGAPAETACAGSAPSTPQPPLGKPKVVYLMGAGRSGSTILGVALGNCADWFFAGELDKWLLMSGISMHERRTQQTGQAPPDRGLWTRVRQQVVVPAELSGRQARRLIEHSTAIMRVLDRRRRGLPRLYRQVSESVYRAVCADTGARIVIDSSHFPLRARQLQSLDGIDLFLVYLVRDPGDVVASWERPGLPEPRSPMLLTNVYLWLTHALALFVFLRQPRARRLLVRYEDFKADPAAIVSAILALADSRAQLPDFDRLDTGRPYHGNRLILNERVAVRRESEDRVRAPMTRWLQAPWSLVLAMLRPVARVS